MRRGVYHVMDISEIKQRLELALRPAEPPTIEEVLEQVSTRGVLRGPVDWVFPGWRLYVDCEIWRNLCYILVQST
jgi:hypothetical protein